MSQNPFVHHHDHHLTFLNLITKFFVLLDSKLQDEDEMKKLKKHLLVYLIDEIKEIIKEESFVIIPKYEQEIQELQAKIANREDDIENLEEIIQEMQKAHKQHIEMIICDCTQAKEVNEKKEEEEMKDLEHQLTKDSQKVDHNPWSFLRLN